MAVHPEDRARSRGVAALLVAALAPAMVAVAAFGVRLGWWSIDLAIDALALRAALYVAFAAPAVALVALITTRRHRRVAAKYAGSALVLSLGVLAGFLIQSRSLAAEGPRDVSTDPADPPALALGGATPSTCEGLEPIMTQLAPETVAAALQSQGFAPTRTTLFRIEASRDGFWFGRRYEAAVRIRPGRTDLRLAVQGDRPDGEAVCRQARAVMGALQRGR